jgi:hypothetical protein
MLVWNKGSKMHFNDCEIAWCSQWREDPEFDNPSAAGPKEHPTQKPVGINEIVIGTSAKRF